MRRVDSRKSRFSGSYTRVMPGGSKVEEICREQSIGEYT
jgi:hypothetical protein